MHLDILKKFDSVKNSLVNYEHEALNKFNELISEVKSATETAEEMAYLLDSLEKTALEHSRPKLGATASTDPNKLNPDQIISIAQIILQFIDLIRQWRHPTPAPTPA